LTRKSNGAIDEANNHKKGATMNHRITPSETQVTLLSTLNIFSKPISKEIVSALTSLPADEFEPMIEALEELGWLKQQDDLLSLTERIPKAVVKTMEAHNSHDQLDKLLECLQRLVESQKVSPTCLILPLRETGRAKEAAIVTYNCSLHQIEEGNYAAALDNCREALSFLAAKSGEEDSDKILVQATLTFSDLCQRVRRDHAGLCDLLRKGMDAALRLGDQRKVALSHLHLGRAYGLMNRINEAVDSLSSGLDLVEKINDRDIITRSAAFFGHFYYLKGLYKDTANFCEMALSRGSLGKDHVPDILTPILLALSSIHMGQFHRAIGVMDSSWRRALLTSDYSLAAYYRAYLGQMLVMAGRIEEGRYHLEAAEKEALDYDDPYTIVWIKRSLAYYYHLKGESRKSYYLLEASLNLSGNLGIRRPQYSLPWILELLLYFKQSGYSPLPGYEFGQEIQFALEGPNALLRGAALRILANQGQDKGENLSKVEGFLLESESELKRSGANIELAKTRAEIALVKLKEGDKEAALDLALKAWQDYPVLKQGAFPNELQLLIESDGFPQVSQLAIKDTLTRYMEMIDRFVPSANLDDMLVPLVSTTCQFFEAERGGFFAHTKGKKNQEFTLRSGYNLTKEQVNSKEFRTNLLTIARAYEGKEPLIISVPRSTMDTTDHQTDSILCLPFELSGQHSGILYYDKLYLDGTFEAFNKNTLSQITKNLGNFIDKIYKYCRQTEIQSREALGNMTVIGQKGIEVFEGLGGAFQDLMYRAETVAKSDVPILIVGETGVGKELLAKRIHLLSARRWGPFVPINPSCITESLVESELFGHEKGAFTGAERQKPGRMELAHKGTLFIDEVGEIPKSIQVKLLRALEEKSFVRVGSVLRSEVDFRLITATNRDLVREVETGNFRQDLYYRLCVVTLRMPPLRDRGDDVIKLAQEFLSHYAHRYNHPVHVLTAEEKSRLAVYQWPGNVRELKNVIEQSVIMSGTGRLELTIPRAPHPSAAFEETLDGLYANKPTIDDLQRRYIKIILNETQGKIGGPSGAAKILGLKRTTLYKRMKKLGLTN
jgi:transcriptional regulator with GAF, ATPase, and Fis domain/tetratricopeptide (TPR) repeat protein